jgi:hypothetical protein
VKYQEVLGKRRGGQEEKKEEGKPREVWRAAQALSLSLLPLSLFLFVSERIGNGEGILEV